MSKEGKKQRKQLIISQRSDSVKSIANKYGWKFSDGDRKTYKLCFIDKLGIYRLDIFLSTFTIGLLALETNKPQRWFRKLGYDKVKDIFKSPTKYEFTI